MEFVSVIIPTHNRAHLITRAVVSVLAAIRPGDEVIVVDDGSTDNTAEVLEPFSSKIRYFRTENRGAGPARNFGLQQARHPLIAFLDSDDEWMHDSLELKRAVLAARPDLVFCFTDFANREESGTVNRKFLVNWHHDTRDWSEILGPRVPFSKFGEVPGSRLDFGVHIGDMYPLLLQRPYVAAWTSLVRRSLAGASFQFAEDLQTAEDWLCFGQVARCGPAAFLDCETAWNHGHSGPRLTSRAGLIGFLNCHLELAERIWGHDTDFQHQHHALYDDVIASIRLKRARWYVSRGRTHEARADLAAVGGVAPRSLKFMVGLPGPLLSAAGGARRLAMDVVNRIR
ncbi:MAG TPA: glycosyltransferase family 2 protein [Longimicrobiales bacterium]